MVAINLNITVCAHNQHPSTTQVARHVQQQIERPAVGVVQILQDQQQLLPSCSRP
jgi:hypothetical protein